MNRFTDIDFTFKRLPAVYGFRSKRLVSIDEALKEIIPQIEELSYYIKVAKKYCHDSPKHGLTRDQSASVYIYTMEWGEDSLYRVLNQALRSEDRDSLRIWFSYMKLLDTALEKLPTVKDVIWRGVSLDIGKNFTKDQIVTWWSVNSCSSSVNVIKNFLGTETKSTLFLIQAVHGKNVSGYTAYPNEDEVILGFGTQFRVKSSLLDNPQGSHIVHLIEIDPDVTPNPPNPGPLDLPATLPCNGRQCNTCGRCRDWYYAGGSEDWQWIRNVRNWDHNTAERWRKGPYYNRFKLHDGARCNRSIYYSASYIVRFVSFGAFDGSALLGHLCVCDTEAGKVK